jgi:hypothetical protein
MRLLVAGSRDWVDATTIATVLDQVVGETPARQVVVVHGACRTGADHYADLLARKRGWDVERHPADWARYGRHLAGAIRNRRMAYLGADVCVVFIRDQSTGASGCLSEARKKAIPTIVWRLDGDRLWLDDAAVQPVNPVHPDQGKLF